MSDAPYCHRCHGDGDLPKCSTCGLAAGRACSPDECGIEWVTDDPHHPCHCGMPHVHVSKRHTCHCGKTWLEVTPSQLSEDSLLARRGSEAP